MGSVGKAGPGPRGQRTGCSSNLELSPKRAAQKARARKRQEKAWKAKCGPVKVTYADGRTEIRDPADFPYFSSGAKRKYDTYLQSKRWQEKRKMALARANHKCAACGATKRLDVHHLTYERLGNERQEDLMVLCRPCHESTHRT